MSEWRNVARWKRESGDSARLVVRRNVARWKRESGDSARLVGNDGEGARRTVRRGVGIV